MFCICKPRIYDQPNPNSFDSVESSKSLIVFLYSIKQTEESRDDWNLGVLDDDAERLAFTEKCEALQPFKHNAIGVYPVEVESIFSEEGAKEVVKKLCQNFPALKPAEAEWK